MPGVEKRIPTPGIMVSSVAGPGGQIVKQKKEGCQLLHAAIVIVVVLLVLALLFKVLRFVFGILILVAVVFVCIHYGPAAAKYIGIYTSSTSVTSGANAKQFASAVKFLSSVQQWTKHAVASFTANNT
jgi:hypothetical protein